MNMRTTKILVLLMFAFMPRVKAQYISLNELISLRGKDFDSVNDYLIAKGWKFTEASEETSEDYAVTSWGYQVNHYTTAAAAFINLRSATGYLPNITYQTINENYYSLYKKQIAAYNMRKSGSTIEDGEVTTVYEGENYLIKITVGTDGLKGIPTYRFNLRKKTSL